jgi:hypothetical protein
MTVAVSTMVPELRVELPGIADPVLNAAIFRGLRKFFWFSESWKYTCDNGLAYTINQQAFNLPVAGTDIPANTVLKRIDTVLYDSGGDDWQKKIEFRTRDQLDRIDGNWWTETGTEPKYWTYDNAVPIWYPIASATVATAALYRCVIAPAYTSLSSTLPDLLYYEFEDYIKAGILADLMKMPGKDWTNPEMSAYYAAIYKAGVDKAKSRAEADFGQPNRTMAYGGIASGSRSTDYRK